MFAARNLGPFLGLLDDELSRSAGELTNTVAPNSAVRAAILGSASPALISMLSLSMMLTGMFLGAPIATHALASKPGWNSPSVRISGTAGDRVAVVTARVAHQLSDQLTLSEWIPPPLMIRALGSALPIADIRSAIRHSSRTSLVNPAPGAHR